MHKITPSNSNNGAVPVIAQNSNTSLTSIRSGLPLNNRGTIPPQSITSLPPAPIMGSNIEASMLLTADNFPSTKGEGDCAFHAIFGENINNQFTCRDVQAKRTALVAWLNKGNTHKPEVLSLITTCIQDLIIEKKLPMGFNPHSYPHIIEARQKNQIRQDIDVTHDIFQEYCQWVEGVGHWMLRGEIQLMAYAFNKTIICLSDGQAPQPYNPGQTDSVTIRFNGTHYERQEVHLPGLSKPAEAIEVPPSSEVPLSIKRKLHNKSKDMQVLYRMLCILIEGENDNKNAQDILKAIASFAGGADGITFKEDDPECIRNRYGRENTNKERAGLINLEQLHRVFIVLDFGIPLAQDIRADLQTLKLKILFILHKELKQHAAKFPPLLEERECALLKDMPDKGDEKHLPAIYPYARENYYRVAIMRIKAEQYCFTEEMLTQDDLYFVGRKIVLIGELCHEIEKDLRKVDAQTKTTLKPLIDAFIQLNRYRNTFVHPPENFVKKFVENGDNRATLNTGIGTQINALYHALQDEAIITKITDACMGIRVTPPPIQKKAPSKSAAGSADVNLKAIEESLQESEAYQSLLESCRRKDSQNLSESEQEMLFSANGPSIDHLFTLADKLNAPIAKINALKMLRAKTLLDARIQADATFKKLFEETVLDIPAFDITSQEQCTEALQRIATVEITTKRVIKHKKYDDIFGQLKKLHDAYVKNNETSIATFKKKHNKALQGQVDTNLAEKAQKTQKKQYAKYQQDYAELAAEMDNLDTQTFINFPEKILAVLDYIAPTTEKPTWNPNPDKGRPNQKTFSQLFGLLVSAFDVHTHSTRDPKVFTVRGRKEILDHTAGLLAAISQEMRYSLTVDDRVKDPKKSQAIKEYVVTLVGQYMRELSETAALKEQLISHIAYEAGAHMQQLRSKGLAHESLRFDPIQFAEDFRKIITPAIYDLHAVHLINQHSHAPSKKIRVLQMLAEAYTRLCFYDEAIKHLEDAIRITKEDKGAIDKEKLEEAGLNTTNTYLIDFDEAFFGIEAYSFKLQCSLAYAYYVKGDYELAYQTAQSITDVVTDVSFATATFLDALAHMWRIRGHVLLFKKAFIESAECFVKAYHLAVRKDSIITSLLYCQEQALAHGQMITLPEDIATNHVNLSSVTRFSLDLARCRQLAEDKNFAEIKKIIESSKILRVKQSHEFKKQLGDRYQLSSIAIIRAEIIYAAEADPKPQTFVDLEQIFQAKLDQLPLQLKNDREVGVTLAYFSRAYTKVAEKQDNVDAAIRFFTMAKDRLDKAIQILPSIDIVLTTAKEDFLMACNNYQNSTLQPHYEASLQLLNLALTLGENPHILTSLGHMHLQQGENAATQESNYTKAAPFYRLSLPPLKKAIMLLRKKQDLTPAEEFDYQELTQSLGLCYEGYGMCCYRHNKLNDDSKKQLGYAIKFYSTYLSFPEKKDDKKIIGFMNDCIKTIFSIDHQKKQTSPSIVQVLLKSLMNLSPEEIAMRKKLLDSFEKARPKTKGEKWKKIFLKNIKDKEDGAFQKFLTKKLQITEAEITIVSPSYITLNLSLNSILLLEALQKNAA